MAYDLMNDEDWRKRYDQRKELERSRQMTAEERQAAFLKAMGRT